MNIDMTAKFETAEYAKEFMTAGHAIVSLRSKKTGAHFTYRITKPQDKKDTQMLFVGLLSGPDNTSNYTYMGVIRNHKYFDSTKNSKVGKDAPSWKAFQWAWENICRGTLPEALEVWHEGRCGRCGRLLTVPESVERGIGPECAKHMGE